MIVILSSFYKPGIHGQTVFLQRIGRLVQNEIDILLEYDDIIGSGISAAVNSDPDRLDRQVTEHQIRCNRVHQDLLQLYTNRSIDLWILRFH